MTVGFFESSPSTYDSDFGISLLKQIDVSEACILSPLSVALALSIIHFAAKGETRVQIDGVFKFGTNFLPNYYVETLEDLLKTSATNQSLQLNFTNRFYIDDSYDIKDSFVQLLKERFGADIIRITFENTELVAEEINRFVKWMTHGKIQEIVEADDLEEETTAIVSAIHMESLWKLAFDPNRTIQSDFYVAINESKKIDMMIEEDGEYLYGAYDDAEILTLPFADQNYSMSFVLPKAEKKFTGTRLQQLRSIQSLHEHMTIKIPKFKLETDFPLKRTLKKLGMKEAFGKKADLSKASLGDDEHFSIGDIKHKSSFEINENGVTNRTTSAFSDEHRLTFVVDHPFLFFVFFKDSLLFIGQFNG